MNCKNCGHSGDGKFCGHCGQSFEVGRINLHTILSQLSESVIQINRGLLYTAKELTVRPGTAIKEFLNGKRIRHFKPVAYVLTMSTLYFLVAKASDGNTWMDDVIAGWMDGARDQTSKPGVSNIARWLSENYAYTTLLLLPVFSLASYVSFKKYGKNYLEHIVINSYVTGHQAIIYSLFLLLKGVMDFYVLETLSMLAAISYTFWVFWQLFSPGNRVWNIIRTIMTYILYLIFSQLFLLLLIWLSGV